MAAPAGLSQGIQISYRRLITPQEPGRSCKTSFDLASEISEEYFHPTVFKNKSLKPAETQGEGNYTEGEEYRFVALSNLSQTGR